MEETNIAVDTTWRSNIVRNRCGALLELINVKHSLTLTDNAHHFMIFVFDWAVPVRYSVDVQIYKGNQTLDTACFIFLANYHWLGQVHRLALADFLNATRGSIFRHATSRFWIITLGNFGDGT